MFLANKIKPKMGYRKKIFMLRKQYRERERNTNTEKILVRQAIKIENIDK